MQDKSQEPTHAIVTSSLNKVLTYNNHTHETIKNYQTGYEQRNSIIR